MKEDGLLIGDELDIHNRMLRNLNDDVDNANSQMHKGIICFLNHFIVDTRLKKLLNDTNT